MVFQAVYKYEVYFYQDIEADSQEQAQEIAESLNPDPRDYEVEMADMEPILVQVKEV